MTATSKVKQYLQTKDILDEEVVPVAVDVLEEVRHHQDHIVVIRGLIVIDLSIALVLCLEP